MASSDAFTNEERLESAKVALTGGGAAGLIGTLFLLLHRIDAVGLNAALAMAIKGFGAQTFWISSAIAALSGTLFGLTYRWLSARTGLSGCGLSALPATLAVFDGNWRKLTAVCRCSRAYRLGL